MSFSTIFATIVVLIAAALFLARAFNKDLIGDLAKYDKNGKQQTWIVQGLNGALAISLLGSLFIFNQSSLKSISRKF